MLPTDTLLAAAAPSNQLSRKSFRADPDADPDPDAANTGPLLGNDSDDDATLPPPLLVEEEVDGERPRPDGDRRDGVFRGVILVPAPAAAPAASPASAIEPSSPRPSPRPGLAKAEKAGVVEEWEFPLGL